MATLTVATAAEAGVATADASATSDGDEFVNTGREVLIHTVVIMTLILL